MKIFITGITGFLGSHIAKKLKASYEVYGLGRKSIDFKGIKVFDLDLFDEVEKPDVIIMCHASVSSGIFVANNEDLFVGNVLFTEKVVNKFLDTKIIYVSSVSVYKRSDSEIDENSSIDPQSEYAVSKLWGEKIIQKHTNSVIVRITSLFGNDMKENTLIPNYANQALDNKIIQVWGNGKRKQNYLHVSDAVKLLECLILNNSELKSEVFIGADSFEYSNFEVASIIAQLTNAKIEFVNEDNSNSFFYKNNYTRNKLNWKPKIMLQQGISEYLEWKMKI